MADIYASWMPGLPASAEAVRIIKECPSLSGIELRGGNLEAQEAKAAGLRLSIHTFFRKQGIALESADFGESIRRPEVAAVLAIADAPIVGFHPLAERPKGAPGQDAENGVDEGIDEERITARCVENLRLACEIVTPKQAAFETMPYYPGYGRRFMTTPSFIARLLRETAAGLIFDVSHVLVSATNRAREDGKDADALVDEIIEASAGRVVQMHINVPEAIADGYRDRHGALKDGDPTSERVLAVARQVMAANPCIEVITLEMYTHTDPVSHARIMVEQAGLVARRLGILTQVARPHGVPVTALQPPRAT